MLVAGFIVIGGGDVGAAHVRQLLRASAAGRLDTDRIVVVDRDPRCPASRHGDLRVRLATAVPQGAAVAGAFPLQRLA